MAAVSVKRSIGFHLLRVFVCNRSTIVTPKKALFDVISLLGDLVIAYWTTFVVIVPKAFRTFHDQCPVHIRVLTMFTGIFRVKGGGLFMATSFCFLTVVFTVVFALFIYCSIVHISCNLIYNIDLHWFNCKLYFISSSTHNTRYALNCLFTYPSHHYVTSIYTYTYNCPAGQRKSQ